MNRPAVTAILVTWQSAASITALLDRLATAALPVEVIVVDNGSTDGTADLVAARGDVTLLRGTNVGFAAGVNRAAALANGRYLLLLNPDADLDPAVLQALVAALEANPTWAAVAPNLGPGDDGLPLNARPWPHLTRRLRDDAAAHGQALGEGPGGRAVRVHWLTGACLLLRRTAWYGDVGPLDGGYFLYWEDADWCLRAARAGWLLAVLPDQVAGHQGGASAASVAAETTAWRGYDSYFRFVSRAHGRLLARLLLLWWLLSGLVAERWLAARGWPAAAADRTSRRRFATRYLLARRFGRNLAPPS
ncbi:MAG: glycosyltransferase family 2 protein [Fimbriimonadaceae bacterium]|nr:glycosyltransferase family 2 protein [Fimbriimonadaceae bacterium]